MDRKELIARYKKELNYSIHWLRLAPEIILVSVYSDLPQLWRAEAEIHFNIDGSYQVNFNNWLDQSQLNTLCTDISNSIKEGQW